MRTLLTGFGPFGDVVSNPSAELAAYFEREGAPGHVFTTRVLPVSFLRAEREIRELLTAGRFEAALLLGVATGEPELRLEQCARRKASDRLDVDGSLPPAADQHSEALSHLSATISLRPLLDELNDAGVPARLSGDAGAYVCNHTYFAALHAIASEKLPTRCFFVHVPADSETFSPPRVGPGMPLRAQIAAIARILDWLRRHEP